MYTTNSFKEVWEQFIADMYILLYKIKWNAWTYKNVRMSVDNATVMSINLNICFITCIKKTLPQISCCWRDIAALSWYWIISRRTLATTTCCWRTGQRRCWWSEFLGILERFATIVVHVSHQFMLRYSTNKCKIMSSNALESGAWWNTNHINGHSKKIIIFFFSPVSFWQWLYPIPTSVW